MAEERQRASSAGGVKASMKSLPASTRCESITDAEEILKLIAETIHQVRTGRVDPRILKPLSRARWQTELRLLKFLLGIREGGHKIFTMMMSLFSHLTSGIRKIWEQVNGSIKSKRY
jgi:hypothetical protein